MEDAALSSDSRVTLVLALHFAGGSNRVFPYSLAEVRLEAPVGGSTVSIYIFLDSVPFRNSRLDLGNALMVGYLAQLAMLSRNGGGSALGGD
eukprot:4524869-Amphidinium_carterae.1